MTKGKPWPNEKETQLQELVASKTALPVIAKTLGKSEEAVRQKIARLGLEVVEQKKIVCSTTSNLPAELFSIEEALKKLAAALVALETPGLDKAEVLRLRRIISGCKIYKDLFSDYVNYRGLETELLELRRNYDALTKNPKGTAPK
jgi:hypothetical protein